MRTILVWDKDFEKKDLRAKNKKKKVVAKLNSQVWISQVVRKRDYLKPKKILPY